MSDLNTPPITPPDKTTLRFARMLLGFGVWFVIGLAPFLGAKVLPGFTAVVEMYPETLRGWLIPLSGLFMGMIAVVVDFAAGDELTRDAIRARFRRAVWIFGVSLLLLIGAYLYSVVRIPGYDAIVTGSPTVPASKEAGCGCPVGTSAKKCILEGITLDADNIEACFGAGRIAAAQAALAVIYLLVTGSFAAAVGLLLLAKRRPPTPATIAP